jgi:hypothetical protein
MALLVYRSKRVLIGMTFVGVMVGAGALLGVVAGVVLALLARSVLAIDTGTGEFIAAWALAGGLVALLLGLYLTVRVSVRQGQLRRSIVAPTTAPATKSN